MAESSASAAFAYLANEQFVNLTTFRRDGRGVPTPVWFAEKDGYVYVFTGSDTGKVKRIRNDGHAPPPVKSQDPRSREQRISSPTPKRSPELKG